MKASSNKVLAIDEQSSWQTELAQAITEPSLLFELLDLNTDQLPEALRASKDFALRVPYPYLQKMQRGQPNDPLLLQVLPQGVELQQLAGYSNDPLQEQLANKIPGLLHKYHGRVLLTITSACSVNCRFCFRRHFPYQENRLDKTNLDAILSYLRQDKSITEVILSGGDPLIATDTYIDKLISQLQTIPHISCLRIHTRLPLMIPQRITTALIASLTKLPQCVVVLHCNHANEIDPATIKAIAKLKKAGITVLNQTVLLRHINDNAKTLAKLNQKLFAAGALPYYLHLLDKVHGAAHFDLPLKQAKKIYAELQKLLPGYLVPKLVREVSGQLHKVIVDNESE